MKSKFRSSFSFEFLIVLTLVSVSVTVTVKAGDAGPVNPGSKSIPWDQIGARAGASYKGDALAVSQTTDGARLHCAFQRLDGDATRDGLWLTSTVENLAKDRFCVEATAVGRGDQLGALPNEGAVALDGQTVRWLRPGLVEEYSAGVDGIRQDFIVMQRPAGSGPLEVRLAVTGADAQMMPDGAQLILKNTRRNISYTRLLVRDASRRTLSARIERAHDQLAVVVDDRRAVYPVRIDPTFTDANWFSIGGVPGVVGEIRAAAVDASGNLYVGGGFDIAGNIFATNVAEWNGSSWLPLGPGLNGPVSALLVSGSTLYAGGLFTAAGGLSANSIAEWNGSAWSALGSGFNGGVSALAISGNTLYAAGGGYADQADVAEWNGSSWSMLGTQMTGPSPNVISLAVIGSTVYAGGEFTKASGIAATNIAQWNGSVWSAVGSGVNGQVYALAASGGILYAGGQFTTAGSVAADYVAQWNGSSWSALGSWVSGEVSAMAVSGGTLYAGGSDAVGQWNGSSWSLLGADMSGEVYALAASGGTVYAGGQFNTAGSTPADNIGEWNGSSWLALGDGLCGPFGNSTQVNALAVLGTTLYVGGTFTAEGNIQANYVAQWNGNGWSALGSGLNGEVSALAVLGNSLYAGGNFTMAGGNPANYIAQWNGSVWSAMGQGMNGPVYALAAGADILYAGGSFGTAGSTAAYGIAQWNGSGWSSLGSGMNGYVNALAVSDTSLYAGGFFTTAGSSSANSIAQWNGTSWSALGAGLGGIGGGNGEVYSLAVSNDIVYAGGNFASAGAVDANYIAEWNGSSWLAMGVGADDIVNALVVSGGSLYVGGQFLHAGGLSVNGIAQWNGTSWSAMGSGITSPYSPNGVYALALAGPTLYAGGQFVTLGGDVANCVAGAIVAPGNWLRIAHGTPGSSTVNLSYAGLPNSQYVVDFSTTMSGPWYPLVTNTTSASGMGSLQDPGAITAQKFYKVVAY